MPGGRIGKVSEFRGQGAAGGMARAREVLKVGPEADVAGRKLGRLKGMGLGFTLQKLWSLPFASNSSSNTPLRLPLIPQAIFDLAGFIQRASDLMRGAFAMAASSTADAGAIQLPTHVAMAAGSRAPAPLHEPVAKTFTKREIAKIHRLMGAISSGNDNKRRSALNELATIIIQTRGSSDLPSPTTLLMAMIEGAEDSDFHVRDACLQALVKTIRKDGLERSAWMRTLLLAMTLDPLPQTRLMAIQALSDIAPGFGWDEAVNVVIAAASDADPMIRFEVLTMLGLLVHTELETSRIRAAVIARTSDPDPKVRHRAVEKLREFRFNDPEEIDTVAAVLRRRFGDEDSQVQKSALAQYDALVSKLSMLELDAALAVLDGLLRSRKTPEDIRNIVLRIDSRARFRLSGATAR